MTDPSALFVDLPNFYSWLLRSGIEEPRTLRDYFLHWLDFDRLAEKLSGEFGNVWVFHSGRRFGPRDNRIQDEHLTRYIERINRLRGVTARDVDIPGTQREPVKYQCENCGHNGTGQWESEKGIDTSVIVQLFDTMDAWNTAYLLSGDADFVPAVAALRRRGRKVIGAGFAEPSPALVRECYEYVDLSRLFFREDVAAYQLFKPSGIAEKWLTDLIESQGGSTSVIKMAFKWQLHNTLQKSPDIHLMSTEDMTNGEPSYHVQLFANGPVNPDSRYQLIEIARQRFPDLVRQIDRERNVCELIVSPLAWNGVIRRLSTLVSTIGGLEVHNDERIYQLTFHYNNGSKLYEPVV
jgi:uncharacterized LabA/DUF88 family protein